MKIWRFLAIAGAVLTVGGAVFIVSRPAAAASAGRKAFRVAPDCTEVEVLDEEAAKEALVAGAIYHFKDMQQRAIDLLVLALGAAIRDSGCPVPDHMRLVGIPGVPLPITVGQIRAILGDRTLEQTQEAAAKGELPPIPGLEAASPSSPRNPVAAILAWTTGGEYP